MRKSFTLIEVLVAIFLLSLLLGLAMYSFKLYIKNFNTLNLTLPIKVINYEFLDKNIKALYPYPINDYKKYYFYNTKTSMQYISLYGFYFNYPVVSKLECINNNLIYMESPLYNKYQNYLKPKILKNLVYKRKLFKFNNRCNFDIKFKNNFPYFIKLYLDNKVYFFKPDINWYKLKDILKSMENNV